MIVEVWPTEAVDLTLTLPVESTVATLVLLLVQVTRTTTPQLPGQVVTLVLLQSTPQVRSVLNQQPLLAKLPQSLQN